MRSSTACVSAAIPVRYRLLAGAATLLAASIGVTAQRGPGQGPNGGPQPVAGLTLAQQQAFADGVRAFGRAYTEAVGLGPVFNDESCADCHRGGGDSNRNVTRIGRQEANGFDGLERLGGSLLQARGIGTVTTVDGTFDFRGEDVPAEATVTARRKSQPLLGLGFVDAVPDATFHAIADEQARTTPDTNRRARRPTRPGACSSFSIARPATSSWAASAGRRRCPRCASSRVTPC